VRQRERASSLPKVEEVVGFLGYGVGRRVFRAAVEPTKAAKVYKYAIT
jgi:hypothetical protein